MGQHCPLPSIIDLAQNSVDQAAGTLCQFVKRDCVLPVMQLGITMEKNNLCLWKLPAQCLFCYKSWHICHRQCSRCVMYVVVLTGWVVTMFKYWVEDDMSGTT